MNAGISMFNKVNLDKVQSVINFNGNNFSFKEDNTIPDLQAKGVTAICKILQNEKQQYAYLADEVGMGKTYQAIGVIAMLLYENINAKILVIAPNRNVQNNWVNEINNFKNSNLKTEIDFQIRSFDDNRDFLSVFTPTAEDQNKNIYITRLSTFSTIGNSVVSFSNSEKHSENEFSIKQVMEGLCRVTGTKKRKKYNESIICSSDAGIICGKFLRSDSPEFDLVVIDEAQNIRNENNATAFINYWLGLKRKISIKSKLTSQVLDNIPETDIPESKYLLLSATPAHRNIDSLRNQLFYFQTDVKPANEIIHEDLEKFLIRRLRTYNNENKNIVREIIPEDVSDNLNRDEKNGLEQRLFLALIQSKLAAVDSAKNNSTYKIGFLEAFETYEPVEKVESVEENGKEFENNGSQKEGEKGEAPDKKMLLNVMESFKTELKDRKYPPHPKFSYMESKIQGLIEENIPLENRETKAPEKAVVFVRRLASVNELEDRLNHLYEQRIIDYWGKILFGRQQSTFQEVRDEFEKLYKERTKKEDSKAVENSDVQDEISQAPDDYVIRCDLIKWMALKNKHQGNGKYAVSKFKKSMLKNKPKSFLFSENYFTAVYNISEVDLLVDVEFEKEVNDYIEKAKTKYFFEYKDGSRRYNYSELLPLCCYLALKRKGNSNKAAEIKNFYRIEGKSVSTENYCSKELISNTLKQDSIWNHLEKLGVEINKYDFKKREVLKAITEKYIKSSEAILELMYCYCNTKNDESFCNEVLKRLFSKECTHGIRIRKLFEKDNGNLVYKQLLGSECVNYEEELKSKLKFLDLQQWVMPAVGGNKGNEGLIKRFNTPFYPDVIVCTDVLKEGINLHLFCNQVYHYGLTWTPGDLEQRIGRIDRFFSKTHRERIEKKDTKIEIIYPFLGKSVDEHQLKQVLKFKLSADPLLDSKRSDQKDISNDIEEKTVKELAKMTPKETDNLPYSGEKYWSK